MPDWAPWAIAIGVYLFIGGFSARFMADHLFYLQPYAERNSLTDEQKVTVTLTGVFWPLALLGYVLRLALTAAGAFRRYFYDHGKTEPSEEEERYPEEIAQMDAMARQLHDSLKKRTQPAKRHRFKL